MTNRDYKDTVFLPKTGFPMRGALAQKEPELLGRWRQMGLYQKIRTQAKTQGGEKFLLHDGPPYANGNIHIGHALNKILKDIVNRTAQMTGKDTAYVPGWDCHGLPIEWKIEEQYRAKGKDKDQVPVLQFRAECRNFAQHWMNVQSEEFQRLGVLGDWENPYSTMTRAAEAQIVREIHKFLLNGLLYKGARPVLWSVVEKTALAEAEVEYHDHKSTTIFVKFPVAKAANAKLKDASIVIWTTTPWTIPGNRAIAFGDFEYEMFHVKHVAEGAGAKAGDVLVAAKELRAKFCAAAGIEEAETLAALQASDLAGTVCAHPFRGNPQAGGYYDFDVPLLAGDFVTTEQGTGFVHIAPGHGEDDFNLGRANNIEVPDMLADDGSYRPWVGLFAGKLVYKQDGKVGDANGGVIKALAEAGCLMGKANITHAYPHSWRSKAPLIFRTTPQWFIAMDKAPKGQKETLRETAMRAIGETRWVPGVGENRIRGMIESRPDWCISRQRAWGVPIALFTSKQSGEVLQDKDVLERIAQAFAKDGADAWYSHDAQEFLGDKYKAADYEQVFDIVDVWFESGSTHTFVLDRMNGAGVWPDLDWPATLYLEGSDQHRGWFHSSLLESCGTRGRAPYEGVLTHGFTLDEQGRKMSKSLGNVIAPQTITDQMGADILRLWVASSDYTQDLRIGPEILKQTGELYRRMRNTLRYLLGALDGISAAERVPHTEMPELERWVLHRLVEVDATIRKAITDLDFTRMLTELHNFCATDLSAFYFDVRKDSLYCDSFDHLHRRAGRTVMEQLFDCLVAWLAPLACFTAEEAWLQRHEGSEGSVHLQQFPVIPAAWRDDALAKKWETVRAARRVVTGAMELARNERKIGSSLQAHPTVYVDAATAGILKSMYFTTLCIASDLTISTDKPPEGAFTLEDVPGAATVIGMAQGGKCERCWRVLPEVGSHAGAPTLCTRCNDTVAKLDQQAA
ncbi:MAG: isoleucine--tRNA ligase [Alphaproteobacteria bacterium]|nr:isoleucine--tRNA ligase [Alphaproteobacteria bacterium]